MTDDLFAVSRANQISELRREYDYFVNEKLVIQERIDAIIDRLEELGEQP